MPAGAGQGLPTQLNEGGDRSPKLQLRYSTDAVYPGKHSAEQAPPCSSMAPSKHPVPFAPATCGARQWLGIQANVGGNKAPCEHVNEATVGVKPGMHTVVHCEPELICEPSTHGVALTATPPTSIEHGLGSQVKVLGVKMPASHAKEGTVGVNPVEHFARQCSPDSMTPHPESLAILTFHCTTHGSGRHENDGGERVP
jgi:hypothetical protein